MTKVATQSSDGNRTSNSDPIVCFHAIDDAESFYRYGPEGYHPVAIGDRLGGHYRIAHKLGHGGYSTVWLARDEKFQRLVTVKVCTADASPREIEILTLLKNLVDDGARGRGMMPTLLDTFRVDGPNGTHTCLVTDLARCSVIEARRSWYFAPLMLPVARVVAAQLILAVDYLHGSGIVHGDLHLGNVLFKHPQDVRLWSDEELLKRCGEPELEEVKTHDDVPIPPGVPLVATLPIWFPAKPIDKLPLSDAHIVLADFGESYCPSQESKLECCTPVHSCPPENRFEPTTPKSFPSDIWTLACTVWATIAQRSLFQMFWGTEDDVTWMQVQTLGKLPDEWWKKWDARSKSFTEEGQLITDKDPLWDFDFHFEDSIQSGRRKLKMEMMESAEKEALLAMLRPMLEYRPEQRCSIKEVLGSEWMIRYGMPGYEKMSVQDKERDQGA